MLYPHSQKHNRISMRFHSKRALSLVAIALLAPTFYPETNDSSSSSSREVGSSWFASAQNVNAGKFASRAKLVEGSAKEKKKKKRVFFGGEEKDFITTDGEFGTSNFWTRFMWWKPQPPPRRLSAVNNYYSSWELVLVESKMIFISLIASVICVAFSWVWYSFSAGSGKENADTCNNMEEEEDGGEYNL